MAERTFLIRLDAALADRFLAGLGSQRESLQPLESPHELFSHLVNGKTARGVIVASDARDLDPRWFREVRRRAPQAPMLVVCRECSDESWRRLLLAGAAGVLRPPWEGIDIEAELASEPALTNMFRRHGPVRQHGKVMFRYSLPSDPEYVIGVVHMVALLAMEFGFPPPDYTMNLPLAVDEALTNAIVHGNGRDARKRVDVEGLVDAKTMRIKIRDEGRGFSREETDSPLDPGNIMAPGGRGLFLIESVMDEVRWTQDGRCIEMIRRHQT